ARPGRIEAGIVEVEPPLMSQAELGGDDLLVDREEAGPQGAALEESPRDCPQERAPLFGGEAVLVTPPKIRLGATSVQIQEDVDGVVEMGWILDHGETFLVAGSP